MVRTRGAVARRKRGDWSVMPKRLIQVVASRTGDASMT